MSPSPQSFVFVVPDPGTTVSGGHLYNTGLIRALRLAGAAVETIDGETFAERARGGVAGRYLVDTLYLAVLRDLPLGDIDVHLVVHHLESLFPPQGQSSDEVFAEIEEPVLRALSGFIATSEFTEFYLVGRGFDPDTIVVVPPAVEGFDGEVAAHEDPGLSVLVVANLVARKQVLVLLQALKDVGDFGGSVRIVGGSELEPEYAQACREIVESHPNLQRSITFVGTLPHDAMPAEYARADVLVSAARMETFGMALQEAVASGTPVFAVDAGFVASHVVEGVTGRLFRSAEEMARGILELAEDRPTLERLTEASREARPQGECSWSSSARRLLESFCA